MNNNTVWNIEVYDNTPKRQKAIDLQPSRTLLSVSRNKLLQVLINLSHKKDAENAINFYHHNLIDVDACGYVYVFYTQYDESVLGLVSRYIRFTSVDFV